MTNPEAQFRRRAIDAMANHADTVNNRLDRIEATVARTADNVAELTANIQTQSANMERLERAVIGLTSDIRLIVEENRSQRETVNNLIKLATVAIEQRAS